MIRLLLTTLLLVGSDAKKGPQVPIGPVPTVTDAAVTLEEGVEYVVSYDMPCIVRSFPKSRLNVELTTLKAGETLILPGMFIDGTGKRETRKFVGPLNIYRVMPVESGPCELMVLPIGGQDADMIVRPILAKMNNSPMPPPPVVPDKPVTPDKPVPAVVTSFRVIIVYESSATYTAAQNGVLYGKVVEDYLTARCTGGKAGWGRRDKNIDPVTDTTALKDMWAAVQPKVTTVPALAIAVNNKVTLEPFPASGTEAVALLKKYSGDK